MENEKLFLNTLAFEYPKEPVKLYFSKYAKGRKCISIASPINTPKEVKDHSLFVSNPSCVGETNRIFTSFDIPHDGFEAVDIDFNNPDNEYFVKLYYRHKLETYFSRLDNIVLSSSSITHDLEVWIPSNERPSSVKYYGTDCPIILLDKYTLRIKYDSYNRTPYLLIALDRPGKLLNIPLSKLFSITSDDPFNTPQSVTPSMLNKVMTVKVIKDNDGKERKVCRIDNYAYLQRTNRYCPIDTTCPILGHDLKQFFGLDKHDETRSFDSKYVKYLDKITSFKDNFLCSEEFRKVFLNINKDFTLVSESQIGRTDSSKRNLVFGKDLSGGWARKTRQQEGVNFGPHKRCPHVDVQIIFVFPKSSHTEAQNLIRYMRNGGYKNQSKSLSHFIGSQVSYAPSDFHIQFSNEHNPIPEIEQEL